MQGVIFLDRFFSILRESSFWRDVTNIPYQGFYKASREVCFWSISNQWFNMVGQGFDVSSMQCLGWCKVVQEVVFSNIKRYHDRIEWYGRINFSSIYCPQDRSDERNLQCVCSLMSKMVILISIIVYFL